MKHLIYLSNNVLEKSGGQNPFFLQEKNHLIKNFGEFNVICPRGVFVCAENGELKSLHAITRLDKILSLLCGIFDLELYKELFFMLKDKKFSPRNAVRLLLFSKNAALLHRFSKKAYRLNSDKEIVAYSYWLDYDAYAAAKLKKSHPEIRAISRAHAYEIQPHRTVCAPYMMKTFICKRLDKVSFISQDAFSMFKEYFSKPSDNLYVEYLGSTSVDCGKVVRDEDEVLTILTCSSVIPLKQLDFMVLALEEISDIKIKWIHIGDGSEMQHISDMVKDKLSQKENIEVVFTGTLPNPKVRELLKNPEIDVFVNMSSSEGVPVSIMEAMSFGLPIIAPKIFGIPELVDSDCGILYDGELGVQGLKESILSFSALTPTQKSQMGDASFEKWNRDFCLERNLENFLFKK